MPLYKSAQTTTEHSANDTLEVALPSSAKAEDKIIVYETKPSESDVLEVHQPSIKFSLPNLPGAPDAELMLEVSTDDKAEDMPPTIKDIKGTKDKEMEISDPWDWKSSKQFLTWLKDRLAKIPGHDGKNVLGVERAISYLKKCINEMSKAMQQDYDGDIDINEAATTLDEMHAGIDRLENHLEALTKKRKKKGEQESDLVKEGQKATHVNGIIVTVPLFISRLARVCINGTISAGHDIETLYSEQVKKYKLNEREQAELIQLLADMNFPVREDRFYKRDEERDVKDGKGDWASNYPA